MNKIYRRAPWLKRLSMQTRQMNQTRLRYSAIESGFYWRALRVTVMGEEHRATNEYFLQPSTLAAEPDYTSIVKKHMDFSKMQKRWARGVYCGNSYAIVADFDLMVENAMLYFPRCHRLHAAAEKLRSMFIQACEGRKKLDWINNVVATAEEEGHEF
jgi:hypothetical protein